MRGSGGGVRLAVCSSIRGGLTGLFLLAVGFGSPGLVAQMADQQPVDDGTGFEFTALVGWLAPLASLTDDPASFGTLLAPSVMYSGDVTLWTSNHIGIGITGIYAASKLKALATQFQGAIPDDLGDVDYLAGMVNLTYRIRSAGSAGSLEPYFTIGGGVKHLGVDLIAKPEVVSSTDPMGTLALGIWVPINSWLRFRGEMRDLVSSFASPSSGVTKMQHDIALTIGLGIS